MIYNLPAYKKKFVLSYENAITGDIIDTLNKCFPSAKKDVLLFAENFRSSNIYDSAFNVWKFVRENVQYKRDPDGIQVLKAIINLAKNKPQQYKTYKPLLLGL